MDSTNTASPIIYVSPDLDIFIYTNENDIQHEKDETIDMFDLDNSLDNVGDIIDDSLEDVADTVGAVNYLEAMADAVYFLENGIVVVDKVDSLEENNIASEDSPNNDVNAVESPQDNDSALPVDIPSPNVIFIVPYRNRENDLAYFLTKMHDILETYPSINYEIKIIHQNDDRAFNRGAIKNLGFLYAKQKYPENYKNITFVFNDVDTTPNEPIFDYITSHHTIKHFYGFKFALGGIVSITGNDFEKINGYPNFWQWGFEDNLLHERALETGFNIDRSQFKEIKSSEVNQIRSSDYRNVNKYDLKRYQSKTDDGIHSIHDINFGESTLGYSLKGIDRKYYKQVEFVDVNHFTLEHIHDKSQDVVYDVRTKFIPNMLGKTKYQMLFLEKQSSSNSQPNLVKSLHNNRQMSNPFLSRSASVNEIMKSSARPINKKYPMKFI